MKDVIVIGAGGHGKVVADIVGRSGNRVLGFLDDNPQAPAQVAGIPVLGGVDRWVQYPDAEYLIAIGNAKVRRQLSEKLQGVRWHTAIHPSAVISDLGVSIGEGTVIMAGAIVNPGAAVGRHCILNTASVVEHDNAIGDYAHISVGAKLAGTVRIGDGCWVGIGAVVSNNLTVCSDCMIGAGAVVVKNITESGVYVGVPARKVK